MNRRVKDFVDVLDQVSLDELIQKLNEIRDSLPDEAGAELRLRGDDVFGRKITVSYFREQTKEEAELDKRYADAVRESRERELERLQSELDALEQPGRGKRGTLRIVA